MRVTLRGIREGINDERDILLVSGRRFWWFLLGMICSLTLAIGTLDRVVWLSFIGFAGAFVTIPVVIKTAGINALIAFVRYVPISQKRLLPWSRAQFDNVLGTTLAVTYVVVAYLVGTVAFFVGWAYAVQQYGLFLGGGLGWIPAFFIACMVGALWPLGAFGLLWLFKQP